MCSKPRLIKEIGLKERLGFMYAFGLFECPDCSKEFEARIYDINSGRRPNCGCRRLVRPIGEYVGELKVVKDLGVVSDRRMAVFVCPSCGDDFEKVVSDAKHGKGKMHCGCEDIKHVDHPETVSIWLTEPYKHLGYDGPKTKHPLYHCWRSMIQRCYNSTHKKYEDYGGRGITVCDRWRNSFLDFLVDMGGRKPSSDHSLDRIDNDKGYNKDNCRWATAQQQAGNKRQRGEGQKVL